MNKIGGQRKRDAKMKVLRYGLLKTKEIKKGLGQIPLDP